jgi:hypothetical protein
MVKLDPGDARSPVLQWYEIKRGKDSGGELLAAFELFQVSVRFETVVMVTCSVKP